MYNIHVPSLMYYPVMVCVGLCYKGRVGGSLAHGSGIGDDKSQHEQRARFFSNLLLFLCLSHTDH